MNDNCGGNMDPNLAELQLSLAVEAALDDRLACWAAGHALSSARMQAIRRAVLERAEAARSPLPQAWWSSLANSLKPVSQSPLSQGLTAAFGAPFQPPR